MRVVVERSAKEAEELVKSVLERTEFGLAAQMPFAYETGPVAIAFEKRRERRPSRTKSTRRIAFHRAKGPLYSVTLLILSGDEAGTRRRTVGRVRVCIGEPHSLSCQSIEIRR